MGLVLALLELACLFGNPLVFLVEPPGSTRVAMYIVGVWGLMLLGLTGLWLQSVTAPPAQPDAVL